MSGFWALEQETGVSYPVEWNRDLDSSEPRPRPQELPSRLALPELHLETPDDHGKDLEFHSKDESNISFEWTDIHVHVEVGSG